MKKTTILTIAIISLFTCILHAQSFNWAHNFGGTDNEAGVQIATDAAGNTYVTGYFNGTAFFDPSMINSSGATDAFLVKYNPAGNVQWATAIGGTGNDQGTAIAVDPGGNIYVAGYFASPTITAGAFTMTNSGGEDIFFIKYSSSGVVLNAAKAGGNGYEKCLSICTDSNDNLYATGYIAGTGTSCTFGSISLTGTGVSSMFIVKYNTSLTAQWAQKAGGYGSTGNARGTGIAVDFSGQPYVVGRFSGGVDFVVQQFTALGMVDMFFAKYNSSGTLSAAYQYYGSSNAQLQPAVLRFDVAGFAYVAGLLVNTATLGSSTLTSAGGTDVLITKINAVGNVQWALNAGGPGDDKATGMAVDAGGNVFISGVFDGSFNFGTIPVNGTNDAFAAKYTTTTSSWQCALTGGSNFGYEIANDITLSGTNAVITGQADGNFNFGNIPVSNNGLNDGFTAGINTLTGINDWSIESAFAISPNPTSTIITFTPQLKTTFTFSVYSYTGQKVMEVKNQTSINVAALTSGLYIAQVCYGEKIMWQKFVKE